MEIRKTNFDLFNVKIDSSEVARRLLEALMKLLELHPHGSSCFEFPTPWNTGGIGITAIQSFTESYIVIDSWPEHEYANVHICSCKSYVSNSIKLFLNEYFEGVKIEVQELETVTLKEKG